MAISANELRIGNWVKLVSGKLITIEFVDPKDPALESFYPVSFSGNDEFTKCVNAGMTEKQISEAIDPAPACKEQCFDCMAIVGERRLKTSQLQSIMEKTKEQIVKQSYETLFGFPAYQKSVNWKINQQYIFPAMDVFAKQQCLAFQK